MHSIAVKCINYLYSFSCMFNHNRDKVIPITDERTNLLANVSVSTELYINFVVKG